MKDFLLYIKILLALSGFCALMLGIFSLPHFIEEGDINHIFGSLFVATLGGAIMSIFKVE